MPLRAKVSNGRLPSWIWPILASIIISGAGWISNAAARETKVTELEARLSKSEARYEREVVPRIEHDYREKAGELRLQKFDDRLDKMQATLEEIAKELRQSNEKPRK